MSELVSLGYLQDTARAVIEASLPHFPRMIGSHD